MVNAAVMSLGKFDITRREIWHHSLAFLTLGSGLFGQAYPFVTPVMSVH